MQTMNEFDSFDRFDFPKGIVRVTAGYGSEAILIVGSEKTALIECGLAYCAHDLIKNIKSELGDRTLDFVMLTHSHYDHAGALPYIRQQWPHVITFGSEYTYKVFSKPSAIDVIHLMNENANRLHGGTDDLKIPDTGYVVDRIVREGDKISLGKEEITVIETKGHTDCCLSFVLNPQSIIFLSESSGVFVRPGRVNAVILKSVSDTLKSYEKCRNYDVKRLVSPHYGLIPEHYNEKYWELLKFSIDDYSEFLFGLFEKGLSDEEVLFEFDKKYWDESRSKVYPKKAFLVNAKVVIRVFRAEYDNLISRKK